MGGEVFATPTCFFLLETFLEVHGESEGGSDGNAEANGNVLLGLSVGLRSWLPSRSVDRDRCSNTKAPVLPNKQNNNLDAGGLKV